MNAEQFKEVEDLFFRLQTMSPDERQAALTVVDPVVREETEKLLGVAVGGADPLTQFGTQVSKLLPIAADARPTTLVGEVVGPYRVMSLIGQGGMGVVYLAEDTRLGRRAALKAILPDAQQTTTRLDRFRREARVLANLSDVNIATVYGLEESHGTLLLAMEYIQGQTLASRLQRGAKLPLHETIAICDQVAAGIQAAHEAGVIHRDLKPANVMITNDGVAKVLDFGLARDIADRGSIAPPTEGLTREGSIFGTPAYMSPEQARGDNLDRRSDIFSFGVLLFRCLAGRLPFDGETDTELADAILHHEPEWGRLPASTPEPIRRLLKRAMAKNPAHRYHHIADARLELREAQTTPVDLHPAKPKRRLTAVLPWAACVLLAAGLIAALSLHKPDSPVPTAQRFNLSLPDNAPQSDLERLSLAVSHDGQQIVLAASTPTVGRALWIRNHTDGQWKMIPQSQDGHRPFISADGQWIGFHRGSAVYKRRLGEGSDAIRLGQSTNWYGASFADDGSTVYASAWNAPLNYLAANGVDTELTKLDLAKSEFSHIGPAVIAGTRWVVYSNWRGGEEADISAVHLDTKASHTLISNGTSPRVANTPRGTYLLFERAAGIFAAPIDTTTAKLTGPASPVVDGVMTDGTRFASYFDVADDGTLVYFAGTSFTEENRLSYVNPDGTVTPMNDDRLAFAEPKFSVDGTKACAAIKGKIYKQIVYDLKRGTRELLNLGVDVTGGDILPDGSGLVITANREGGYGVDLYSLTTGRIVRRIVAHGGDYPTDLSVSHDGKFLVFTGAPATGKPRDLWIIDLAEGAKPKPLLQTPYTDMHGAVSPNGKWVACTSEMSGRREVHIVGVPDGQPNRQITYNGGSDPAWSPDGKWLYYIGQDKLMRVAMSEDGRVTSPPETVYDKPFGQSDSIARNMTVAPDGRPVIVEPSERRPKVSNLQVITNWWTLLPK